MNCHSSLILSVACHHIRVKTCIMTNLFQRPTRNYNHFVSILKFSFYVMWHPVRQPTHCWAAFCPVLQLIALAGFNYSTLMNTFFMFFWVCHSQQQSFTCDTLKFLYFALAGLPGISSEETASCVLPAIHRVCRRAALPHYTAAWKRSLWISHQRKSCEL